MKTSHIIAASCLLSAILATSAVAAKKPAPPPQVAVAITSEPAGAAVKIDGTQRGVTPLELQLPPGKRLVELSLKDHEGAVRTIDCALPSASSDFKLVPTSAPVLIITEPAGASVTRDGAFAGITPLLLPEVAVGRYRINFELAGYKNQQVDLTVASSAPQQIKTALINSSATLDITSFPAGARISVNGIPRGAAPLTVDKIQEGESVVEIAYDGYSPYKERLTLAAGEVFAIHAQLVAIPAKLGVISVPPGAKVYFDNRLRGETPLEIDGIAAGSYRVRVELDNHETMARNVDLKNDEELIEEFKMAKTIGSLRVTTSPADVYVFIGGKEYGKTSATEENTDQISDPLDLTDVPAGENEIIFERKGYGQQKRTVMIERGETAVIEMVKLSRHFVPDIEVTTPRGVYKGVYVNRDAEFFRIETSPGVIRSFPLADVKRIRNIRADENKAEDTEGLGGGE